MNKLFNISEAANIAIHSLAMIANCEKNLSATEISRQLSFSRNHVAKVLQTLCRSKMIASTRGPKGGFVLTKTSESITIFDIMELMDGKIQLRQCGGCSKLCQFEECVYGDMRQRLFAEFKSYYSNRTFADLKLKNIES